MYKIPISNLDMNRLDKIAWILASQIVNENVWLAGGAMRTIVDPNDRVVDYDLYFRNRNNDPYGYFDLTIDKNQEEINTAKEKLTRLGFELIYECPEGKLFTYVSRLHRGSQAIKHKVQLICEEFYVKPEDVINQFDLHACRFITDGKFVWTDRDAIKSVKKKMLHINLLNHPVSTFKRIIKYEKKGYQVNECIEEYIKELGNLVYFNGIQIINDKQFMRRYID